MTLSDPVILDTGSFTNNTTDRKATRKSVCVLERERESVC